MASTPKKTVATIIPTLRYNDAAAAVEWLCRAFGFEQHLVVPGENGTVLHAELTFGNGMIMLGSVRDTPFAQLQQPPAKRAISSPKALTFWWMRWISTMRLRSPPEPKLSWRFKTKTTAGATILAATPRATCGTLAPTTPGAPHHYRCRPKAQITAKTLASLSISRPAVRLMGRARGECCPRPI
jgi:hypothetical protein